MGSFLGYDSQLTGYSKILSSEKQTLFCIPLASSLSASRTIWYAVDAVAEKSGAGGCRLRLNNQDLLREDGLEGDIQFQCTTVGLKAIIIQRYLAEVAKAYVDSV